MSTLAPAQRRVVEEAWVHRRQVELAAEIRFASLAVRLEHFGAPYAVTEATRKASGDEARHAGYCTDLAYLYGHPRFEPADVEVGDAAPGELKGRQRLIYEVTAASCVAETESIATLTTLLDRVREPALKRILRELAADEVNHSRLGWSYLSFENGREDLRFLGPLLPRMLANVIPPGMYAAPPPAREADGLLDHGVLTHSLRRTLFRDTLLEVVFPGLERFRVDTTAARRWLAMVDPGQVSAFAPPQSAA